MEPVNFGDKYETLDPEGDIEKMEVSLHTCWQFPLLHKLRKGKQTEKKNYWQIKFNGDEIISYNCQAGGQVGIHNKKIILASKNTLSEQAFVHARKAFRDKQIKEGYVLVNETAKKSTKPMSGEHYEWEFVEGKRIGVEPKWDGVRCEVHPGPKPISRYGRPLNYLDHLYSGWQFFQDRLPKGCILEGELKDDKGEDFEQLISGVRRSKNYNPNVKKLKFFMFDFMPTEDLNLTFEQRLNMLKDIYQQYIQNNVLEVKDDVLQFKPIILLDFIPVNSHQEIMKYHKLFRSFMFNGKNVFEGTIVRQLDALYSHGKGKAYLKIVDVMSEEYPIVDIEACGANNDWADLILEDKQGKRFNATAPGNEDNKKRILREKDKEIGKMLTIEFREFTKKGLPRMPIAKTIEPAKNQSLEEIKIPKDPVAKAIRDYE